MRLKCIINFLNVVHVYGHDSHFGHKIMAIITEIIVPYIETPQLICQLPFFTQKEVKGLWKIS